MSDRELMSERETMQGAHIPPPRLASTGLTGRRAHKTRGAANWACSAVCVAAGCWGREARRPGGRGRRRLGAAEGAGGASRGVAAHGAGARGARGGRDARRGGTQRVRGWPATPHWPASAMGTLPCTASACSPIAASCARTPRGSLPRTQRISTQHTDLSAAAGRYRGDSWSAVPALHAPPSSSCSGLPWNRLPWTLRTGRVTDRPSHTSK
jgi:hypothetical protein